jgi:hypothetical protein
VSQPVFLSWLWAPQGGWREGAGYTPEIIQGLQYMLRKAVPECRHICIADEEFRPELIQRGIEHWPLWDVHGRERTEHYGFDCNMRLGLWGTPGAEMAEVLGLDVVQWLDCDVMIRPTARAALLDRWDTEPEMFWVPRGTEQLRKEFKFGANVNTWLGVNGSMVRLRLGSRPDWWNVLKKKRWLAETERHICGSDQAAITRLVLESRGEQWKEGNPAILDVPRFDNARVVAHGMWASQYDVAFFPYDLDTDYTKPWLTANAYLRREYMVLAGRATEAEQRAEVHPGLRRYMGRR